MENPFALQVEATESKRIKAEPAAGPSKAEPKAEPKAAEPRAEEGGRVFTVDLPTLTCTMYQDRAAPETASLFAGPNNLLQAKFGTVVHTTELSNLMLMAGPPAKKKKNEVVKKPAAGAAKRPAAAVEDEEENKDYSILYYKNNNSAGVRQKFGAKKQVFSFGGLACKKTKEQLSDIAKIVRKDLVGGASADHCKKKAQELADEEE